MQLNICHLYPDILNLYGDIGNIICMQKRLSWRGIDTCVSKLTIGCTEPLSGFDLIFIGGGQDFEQGLLIGELKRKMASELKAAIEDGVAVLAICAGFQILGYYYKTHNGDQCDFAGALDMYTIGQTQRFIGDYAFECAPESGGSTVVGFENHGGRTYLGSGLAPLGRILRGSGNNGEDQTEGARYNNVFGTYCHGPILPKNPLFTDFLLDVALRRKYPELTLTALDDTFENKAHDCITGRLSLV